MAVINGVSISFKILISNIVDPRIVCRFRTPRPRPRPTTTTRPTSTTTTTWPRPTRPSTTTTRPRPRSSENYGVPFQPSSKSLSSVKSGEQLEKTSSRPKPRLSSFKRLWVQRVSNMMEASVTSCEGVRGIHRSAMEIRYIVGKGYSDSMVDANNNYEAQESSPGKSSLEATSRVPPAASDSESQIKGSFFIDGELAMIIREDIKRHTSMKVIVKLTDNGIFSCKYGAIPHRSIIGQSSCREFLTSRGLQVLIRRPTLDDYILRMRRLPVISFPKDICTMLMMIDASPGDVILEAGTGSGAMTLFLSKAVGYQGKVHTVEIKRQHFELAIKNFNRWKESWNLSHNCKWTSNVQFHHGSLIKDGYGILEGLTFDGAVLDMEECHTALPVIKQFLKNGGAVCLYVANITQVIEICEIIRIQELPFTVENIVEVDHRYWLVNPARRRNGTLINMNAELKTDKDGKEEERADRSIGSRVPKYIARPSKEGTEHSAFLVKVVKLESFPSSYKV